MIYTHITAALLSAALAFGAAWKTQDWRYGAKEKERAEQQIAMEREHRALDNKRSSGVIAAQNAGRVRDMAMRRGADLARTELVGLRAQSAAALLAGRDSLDACVASTARFSVALNECAEEYQTMGEVADRWQSDAVMLRDAWPGN